MSLTAVSFADDCRRANSTRLASRRGYIALYPRAWRVAGAADLLARRGALGCRWTISAARGRRITVFSARVGARLYRVIDNSSATAGSATDPLWCPASVQLVELDGSVAGSAGSAGSVVVIEAARSVFGPVLIGWIGGWIGEWIDRWLGWIGWLGRGVGWWISN